MHGLEVFHYYRQDVINSRYRGSQLFRFERNNASVIRIKDVMKCVKSFKDECRSLYDVVEEYSIVVENDGRIKKEYRVCIFGEDGEIGLFFQLRTPLFIDEKAGARASPVKGLKRKRF